MTSSRYLLIGSFAVVLGLSLAACTKDNSGSFTYGPASGTGILVHADNSLIRRGTHILMVNGEKMFYVESRTQNMTELEGQVVFVEGTLEPNSIKTDLPVLVATSVKRSHGDEDLRRFEIPALNLRLGVPQTWAGTLSNGVATFKLSGESDPILTIRRMSGSTLPPGGSPLFVKNRRGTRIEGEGNASDVYLLERTTLIELHFDPASQRQLETDEQGAIVASQFERLLSTMSFISDKETPTIVTGSGAGVPCGGVAGVLCPSGFFCNITDSVNQIGQCKERR